ncbi:MAG: OmpH family outer membrane protein [Bacteroidales bacterium]
MEEDIIKNNRQQPQVESTPETSGNSCEPAYRQGREKKCKCCINILNIIALIGVIVLFVLYFTGQPGSYSSDAKKSSMAISFVNSDSIMVNYELVKVMKTDLEEKQKKAEDNFSIQQKSFETQVIEYQKKMQSNSLSIDQAKSTEKLLGQQQQTLLDLKDQLSQTLAEEELKMNIALQDSIMNFLKRYNRKHNYDYILGFSKGSGILFANDSLDITKEILEGLNKEYK